MPQRSVKSCRTRPSPNRAAGQLSSTQKYGNTSAGHGALAEREGQGHREVYKSASPSRQGATSRARLRANLYRILPGNRVFCGPAHSV
eukprot:2070231-Rhodomonas_salina.1